MGKAAFRFPSRGKGPASPRPPYIKAADRLLPVSASSPRLLPEPRQQAPRPHTHLAPQLGGARSAEHSPPLPASARPPGAAGPRGRPRHPRAPCPPHPGRGRGPARSIPDAAGDRSPHLQTPHSAQGWQSAPGAPRGGGISPPLQGRPSRYCHDDSTQRLVARVPQTQQNRHARGSPRFCPPQVLRERLPDAGAPLPPARRRRRGRSARASRGRTAGRSRRLARRPCPSPPALLALLRTSRGATLSSDPPARSPRAADPFSGDPLPATPSQSPRSLPARLRRGRLSPQPSSAPTQQVPAPRRAAPSASPRPPARRRESRGAPDSDLWRRRRRGAPLRCPGG